MLSEKEKTKKMDKSEASKMRKIKKEPKGSKPVNIPIPSPSIQSHENNLVDEMSDVSDDNNYETCWPVRFFNL